MAKRKFYTTRIEVTVPFHPGAVETDEARKVFTACCYACPWRSREMKKKYLAEGLAYGHSDKFTRLHQRRLNLLVRGLVRGR